MKSSVIICTWNRAELLDQTLAQMRYLDVPSECDWELVVVNNHCTDNTDEVIERHASELPLRRLYQPRPGKAWALNRAVQDAKGELLVFTDDDVLVDPGWLAGYSAATEMWPEAAFFGGPVLPWFEGTPPRWLEQGYSVVADAFAARDFGPEAIAFTTREVPFGANMAVRSESHGKYLYDTRLGPQPDSKIRGGEETKMMRQMLADGLEGRWVPDATVKHFIPRSRQTKKYLWQFFTGYGATECRKHGPQEGVHWLGKPRWLWKQLVLAAARYYARYPWVSMEARLKDMQKFGVQYGQFCGYRAQVES